MLARRRPSRGLAVAALATAAAATALATAGCGASNLVDPVATAATISTVSPGYRMTMALSLSSPLLPNPITGTGSGRFDITDHSGSFVFTVRPPNVPQVRQTIGTGGLKIAETTEGTTLYMRLPAALASRSGMTKPWVKVDLSRAGGQMPGGLSNYGGSFTTDPSQTLQYLRADSGSVTTLGTATVAGITTTHYRATIDLTKVAAHAPAANRARAEASVRALEKLTHFTKLPVDVWIDGHHLVRKMVMNFSITVQGVPLTMSITEVVPHYGPEAPISAPPASEVAPLPVGSLPRSTA